MIMAGTSSQGLDIVNCETSSEKKSDSIIESPPGADVEYLEPHISMEFISVEAAYNYYNQYAKRKGFIVRRNHTRLSGKDRTLIGVYFVCSKEGKRARKYLERRDRVFKMPAETRVGCKAMLGITKRGEIWVATKFESAHNHELFIPKRTTSLRSQRKSTNVKRKRIDMYSESGVRAGSIMSVCTNEADGKSNVGFIQHDDIHNYLSTKRQRHFKEEDAAFMLRYFQECQARDPGFFYAVQMDVKGRLANCFWVDARSRISYQFFGDVVTSHSTYLTNHYDMCFVPFTGVNHHRQTILFGCGLLLNETEESFSWLLETWLKAMPGPPPVTIITDQDAAMVNAIARVLPHINHHLCMWHIEKNVEKHMGHLMHKYLNFKKEFDNCIHNIVTVDEFESAWKALIETYGLHNDGWFQKLYDIRKRWIPAYVRTTFCAGMSTTQRSESVNDFFKQYVSSGTLVSEFVVQFDKALDNRYVAENEKDLETMNSNPVTKTLWCMEREAAEKYTRSLFHIFQEELFLSQVQMLTKIGKDGSTNTYSVVEEKKENSSYIVTFDISEVKAVCTCRKFEFEGILCRHILATLIKKKIFSLPSHYILYRWTRYAKSKEVQERSITRIQANSGISTLWRNDLMFRFLEVIEHGSRSKKHYDYTLFTLHGLRNHLVGMKAVSDETQHFDSFSGTISEVRVREENQVCPLQSNVTISDPARVARKERLHSLRTKSSSEPRPKFTKTCSVCGCKGHTKPRCPKIKQSGESSSPATVHSDLPGSPNLNTTENIIVPSGITQVELV